MNLVKKPTIAVALPVYNGADYLALAIDSILRQERYPDEIVVLDDASSDGTAAVLQEYQTHGLKIHRLDERVLTPQAWNAAVRRTVSDFVLVFAHDDILHPRFLAEAARTIAEHDADLFISLHEIIDESGNVIGRDPIPALLKLPGKVSPTDFLNAFTREGQFFLPSGTVFRRTLFDSVGGFDENLKVAYDWDFFLRIAPNAKIWISDQLLMQYRVHSTQSIAAHTRRDNGDSDVLFAKLPTLTATFSERQKTWLVEGMCNFLRRFATLMVADHARSAREVVSARDRVERHLAEWQQAPNQCAKYVKPDPRQWRQWLIWNSCRSTVGVHLARLALDVSGQMPAPKFQTNRPRGR